MSSKRKRERKLDKICRKAKGPLFSLEQLREQEKAVLRQEKLERFKRRVSNRNALHAKVEALRVKEQEQARGSVITSDDRRNVTGPLGSSCRYGYRIIEGVPVCLVEHLV